MVSQPLGDLRSGKADAVGNLPPAAIAGVDEYLRSQAQNKSREHVDQVGDIKRRKKKHDRPCLLLLEQALHDFNGLIQLWVDPGVEIFLGVFHDVFGG